MDRWFQFKYIAHIFLKGEENPQYVKKLGEKLFAGKGRCTCTTALDFAV